MIEDVDQIRTPVEELVVDGEGAGDLRLSARLGALETQETHQIGSVGVKVLSAVGAVDAHRGAGARDALVADMTQQAALRVLADGCAELEPQPDVRGLDRVRGEALDRKATQQEEASTLAQLGGPRPQLRREPRQVELLPGQRGGAVAVAYGPARGVDDLVALLIVERERPFVGVGHVRRAPDGG